MLLKDQVSIRAAVTQGGDSGQPRLPSRARPFLQLGVDEKRAAFELDVLRAVDPLDVRLQPALYILPHGWSELVCNPFMDH